MSQRKLVVMRPKITTSHVNIMQCLTGGQWRLHYYLPFCRCQSRTVTFLNKVHFRGIFTDSSLNQIHVIFPHEQLFLFEEKDP